MTRQPDDDDAFEHSVEAETIAMVNERNYDTEVVPGVTWLQVVNERLEWETVLQGLFAQMLHSAIHRDDTFHYSKTIEGELYKAFEPYARQKVKEQELEPCEPCLLS